MKEYEIEVDDKKKFMKEIEALMKDGSMYWFKDDKGEVGINTSQINSIEFLDDDGISNMVEGGLTLKVRYEMINNNSCKVFAKVE